MCGSGNCFELRLRKVGRTEKTSKPSFVKCVSAYSRIPLLKTSPTRSTSSPLTIGILLTLSAAFFFAATPLRTLAPVPTRDSKVVRRWSIAGGPRGVALGNNGLIYVGLADKQAVQV